MLQLFTDLNPETSRVTTIGPLLIVLMISMTKQAVEDLKRHHADKVMNNRVVTKLKADGTTEIVRWHEVRVGDILLIRDREEFPADLVLLATSEEGGKCFTETANLDGETNLKRRTAIKETSELCSEAMGSECTHSVAVSNLSGLFEYEQPNNRLYNFNGRLTLHAKGETKQIPLIPEFVILRGCMLKSCKYVYGAVMFTGSETKIMKNMRPAPLKTSNVYKVVNQCIWIVFLAEVRMYFNYQLIHVFFTLRIFIV